MTACSPALARAGVKCEHRVLKCPGILGEPSADTWSAYVGTSRLFLDSELPSLETNQVEFPPLMLSKPMKLTKRGEVTPLTKRLEGRWWEESSVELSLV